MPYGDRWIDLCFPNDVGLTELKPPYAAPLSAEQIVDALRRPVGTPPLAEMCGNRRRIVIVLENASRPLNTRYLLPFVLAEITRAGGLPKDVSFLFANGAHGGMEEDNRRLKLGEGFEEHEVFNHDCREKMTDLGLSSRGSPIRINPLVKAADFKIGLGTIEPHHGYGMSGGAKILFPGCAGLEWIIHNHAMSRGECGVMENPQREDSEECAAAVGLDFLVNAVLNYRREIVGLFCGDMVGAHRQARSVALHCAQTRISGRFDLVVASASPFDLNFFQTMKAVTACTRVLEPGGTFLLLAHCPQGLGAHGWLQGREMLASMRAEYRRLSSDYQMVFYSTRLSPDELHRYLPPATILIRQEPELIERLRSLCERSRRGALLPYAPITIPSGNP